MHQLQELLTHTLELQSRQALPNRRLLRAWQGGVVDFHNTQPFLQRRDLWTGLSAQQRQRHLLHLLSLWHRNPRSFISVGHERVCAAALHNTVWFPLACTRNCQAMKSCSTGCALTILPGQRYCHLRQFADWSFLKSVLASVNVSGKREVFLVEGLDGTFSRCATSH
jgi:hypothetical protein